MLERNIDCLPLRRPLLGLWPATQACAGQGIEPALKPFGFHAGAQSSEPHQPGRDIFFSYLYFPVFFKISAITTCSSHSKTKRSVDFCTGWDRFCCD